MKPIIILPEGLMKPEDLEQLRKNDLCVVECKDPSKVKFVDPIPAASSRTQIEDAAIKLSRVVLNGQWNLMLPEFNPTMEISQSKASTLFVKILTKGTELDANNQEYQRIYDNSKLEEMRRLGREDAKKEREKLKSQAAADKKP